MRRSLAEPDEHGAERCHQLGASLVVSLATLLPGAAGEHGAHYHSAASCACTDAVEVHSWPSSLYPIATGLCIPGVNQQVSKRNDLLCFEAQISELSGMRGTFFGQGSGVFVCSRNEASSGTTSTTTALQKKRQTNENDQ